MSNNPTDSGADASNASASTTYSFVVDVYEDVDGITPFLDEIEVDVETTRGSKDARRRAKETAIEYIESQHPSITVHSVETMLVDIHIEVDDDSMIALENKHLLFE